MGDRGKLRTRCMRCMLQTAADPFCRARRHKRFFILRPLHSPCPGSSDRPWAATGEKLMFQSHVGSCWHRKPRCSRTPDQTCLRLQTL